MMLMLLPGLFLSVVLVKIVPCLDSLRWPEQAGDLGGGGVSYVKLLILCELWDGERLVLEKALLRCGRGGRQISVSAVPLGPGIDIWRTCRFLGSLFGAFGSLLGGFERFFPYWIGGTIAATGTLGGRKVGMDSRPGPGRLCRFLFWDEL